MVGTILKNPLIGFENRFAGNYDIVPDDRIEVGLYTGNFIIPKWNVSLWIEGATEEQIDQVNLEKKKEFVRQFLNKKKTDGRNYFNEKEIEITILLAGMMLTDLVIVSDEIEKKIMPFLNFIKTGDYFNCIMKFQRNEITSPTNQIVLNLYNEIQAYATSYFNENYPTETI